MADLTTFAQIEAELAATAGYDVNDSVDEAKRRVAALRRKLDFAEQSEKEGSVRFNQLVIEKQLNQAIQFVRENQTLTEAQKKANPGVVHGDFSRTGQYSGGASSYPNEVTP